MSARAILFPGQGAQCVGMGKDLAEAFPECRALFEQANDVLGFDLARLCFEGPEDVLTQSDNAQPAIFVTSMACYRAFRMQKPEEQFRAAAGLSSGEWTALHTAGVISYEDTLRVLQARGRAMQEACRQNPGTMLSVIGLDRQKLSEISAEAGVEIANLNSPEQTVLSGRVEGIARAEELAKQAGAKRAIRLNVAGAFHSALMQPAAMKLADFLSGVTLSAPSLPVVANVTALPHESPTAIRKRMIEQVTSSVRWVESIQWMGADGINAYLECGPGRVLSGLVKRIDKQAALHNIQDRSSLDLTVKALLET
ncbi:MAG: ACP S-malonyltransferase [Kiritimatiellae bacterium]|nr:ACP S-malonyltransferase [Kiritimatiellia bacterium]